MLVAVQAIQVVWTKASRGGAGAARRNAVPEAFALSLPPIARKADTPALPCLSQRLRCDERSAFLPHPQGAPTYEPLIDPRNEECVVIQPPGNADLLRVTYRPRRPRFLSYARDQHGDYQPGGREAFALHPGEWGRVRYNWRHADWEDTWYDQWVVNVGYFREWRTDAFLAHEPVKVFSDIVGLW